MGGEILPPETLQPEADSAVLSVRELQVQFNVRRGKIFNRRNVILKAVDGVTFDIRAGETFSIVGESGCGKSTTARSILKVERPTGGEIRWRDKDIQQLTEAESGQYRLEVQAVFQDPYSSMNPRLRIADFVGEPMLLNAGVSAQERLERSRVALEQVGLGADDLNNFPHEFSGGQRQRLAIARAILLQPAILLLDDPTAAIDSGTEQEIFAALDRAIAGRTTFIVAHRLSTLRRADFIIVLERGRIVQQGTHERLMRETGPYQHVASLQLVDGRELGAAGGEAGI